ncbi:hypothetical protein JQ604_24140 [Bradyrhizobium jicamae]|uniref:hypothetical protein n=1 Tax=Bradyrhizobium jicamae TaxID=280332 RepID=UPI001BAAA7F6|nr:hypothetical protein [Bradyrhizobium jicamae]MBR0755286.1 hypothetical protein [Bradyrhizobium jicamae]
MIPIRDASFIGQLVLQLAALRPLSRTPPLGTSMAISIWREGMIGRMSIESSKVPNENQERRDNDP